MKFELTTASFKHAGITLGLCVASLAAYKYAPAWLHPYGIVLLCALPYIWREEKDLNQRHKGNRNTWNSAELIMPLLICAAIAVAVWMIGGF